MLHTQSVGVNSREIAPTQVLSERTLGELRSTLRGHLRLPVSDADIRRVMRAMSMEARAQDLPAEKVVVLLKTIWQNLAEADGRPFSRRSEILDRFITICIEEFYASKRDDAPIHQ